MTTDIDFSNMTVEEAWELYDKHLMGKTILTTLQFLDKNFSELLRTKPRVDSSIVVNGYTIEFCDCILSLVFRIPQISNQWMVYLNVNTWDSQWSWEPDTIRFGVDNQYIISTETWELFKLEKYAE